MSATNSSSPFRERPEEAGVCFESRRFEDVHESSPATLRAARRNIFSCPQNEGECP
jgi:hypothetical protein